MRRNINALPRMRVGMFVRDSLRGPYCIVLNQLAWFKILTAYYLRKKKCYPQIFFECFLHITTTTRLPKRSTTVFLNLRNTQERLEHSIDHLASREKWFRFWKLQNHRGWKWAKTWPWSNILVSFYRMLPKPCVSICPMQVIQHQYPYG